MPCPVTPRHVHGTSLAGGILTGSLGTLGDTAELLVAVDAAIASEGPPAPSMLLAQVFGSFNDLTTKFSRCTPRDSQRHESR